MRAPVAAGGPPKFLVALLTVQASLSVQCGAEGGEEEEEDEDI